MNRTVHINRLYLIGNGFDLAHGYKMRYSDFFLDYLRSINFELQEKNEYEDSIVGFLYLKAGDALPNDPTRCSMDSLIENIKSFNSPVKRAQTANHILWDEIFDNDRENWMDIENLYFSSLSNYYKDSDKVLQLNREFDFLEEKLCAFISKQKKAKINLQTIGKGIEEIKERKPQSTLKDFIKRRLTDLNDTNFTYRQELAISFNYTETHARYFNGPDDVNIHGSLDDTTNNPIIFGYGDERHENYILLEKENKNELLSRMKSFGYSKSDNYSKLITFIESQKFVVEMMGHSGSISDRTLLSTIFEHENCIQINPYFFTPPEERNDATKNRQAYTNLVTNISRHFDDKVKMRDRISDYHINLRLPQHNDPE